MDSSHPKQNPTQDVSQNQFSQNEKKYKNTNKYLIILIIILLIIPVFLNFISGKDTYWDYEGYGTLFSWALSIPPLVIVTVLSVILYNKRVKSKNTLVKLAYYLGVPMLGIFLIIISGLAGKGYTDLQINNKRLQFENSQISSSVVGNNTDLTSVDKSKPDFEIATPNKYYYIKNSLNGLSLVELKQYEGKTFRFFENGEWSITQGDNAIVYHYGLPTYEIKISTNYPISLSDSFLSDDKQWIYFSFHTPALPDNSYDQGSMAGGLYYYGRLELITGNVEKTTDEYVRNKVLDRIESGVSFSQLINMLSGFSKQQYDESYLVQINDWDYLLTSEMTRMADSNDPNRVLFSAKKYSKVDASTPQVVADSPYGENTLDLFSIKDGKLTQVQDATIIQDSAHNKILKFLNNNILYFYKPQSNSDSGIYSLDIENNQRNNLLPLQNSSEVNVTRFY